MTRLNVSARQASERQKPKDVLESQLQNLGLSKKSRSSSRNALDQRS